MYQATSRKSTGKCLNNATIINQHLNEISINISRAKQYGEYVDAGISGNFIAISHLESIHNVWSRSVDLEAKNAIDRLKHVNQHLVDLIQKCKGESRTLLVTTTTRPAATTLR